MHDPEILREWDFEACVSPLIGIEPLHVPAVLVVMAIDAQVFPITPVLRVVVMVAVAVVYGQQMQRVAIEFPSALGADPAV